MSLNACFLALHNESKQRGVSLKKTELHFISRRQQTSILTFTLENGVIYSHIFITLQAAILPAKNVNKFKLFVDK